MSDNELVRSLDNLFLQEKDRYISKWSDFVRFKSISANKDFDQDCVECARWCCAWLKDMGFESRLLETVSKPVVYGHFKGDSARPRILFYGHYDVQPPEPYELWQSAPFEPEIRNGRLYGRGAQDNKGQVSFAFAAIETLIKKGELRNPLTIILEGEEETGSFGLADKLNEWTELLSAEILMVCDTGALSPGIPCITMGLRGIYHMEVKLQGPLSDLHSGVFGGVVKNPAIELSRILAQLHNPDGSIAIPGYYAGITEPTAEEKALLSEISLKPEHLAAKLGCELAGGESRFSFHERRGLRPTLDINGLWSGYMGPGSKTIIPSFAQVKLTGRTVRGQDPELSMKLVEQFLKDKAPKGTKLEIVYSFVGGPAVYLEATGDLITRLRDVLHRVSGQRVEATWEGGSIPIVAALARSSGAKPVLVGFALDGDNLHAPNESFSISQFQLGFKYIYQFLKEM